MGDILTLAKDSCLWLFCALCYRVYLWTPCRLMPNGWEFALLPYAGRYAYSTSWADFRETAAWNRAGRPEDWQWGHR